jgi:phosphoesterase RecJ-like protein
MHRAGDMKMILEQFIGTKILIDHHLEPSKEFDFLYSTNKTSSTAELVYDLIEEAGDKNLINKPLAEALYVGLMTDTGSFSYACNHPNTFHIAGNLINAGVDGERIHRLVYDTFSEDRLNLLGFCLSDRLTVRADLGIAYIYLTSADLKRFNYQVGDTEGVVNYALSIDSVNVAVLLTERDKLIRMSFRSKSDFSVNDFARKYFDGGGHQKAAGGNSSESMKITIEKMIKSFENHKDELLLDSN